MIEQILKELGITYTVKDSTWRTEYYVKHSVITVQTYVGQCTSRSTQDLKHVIYMNGDIVFLENLKAILQSI